MSLTAYKLSSTDPWPNWWELDRKAGTPVGSGIRRQAPSL